MRVIFMGSPDFAVPTLDMLVSGGHEVVAVYTQPPRPAGRGKSLQPTAVENRARALGLQVRSPKSLRDPDEQAAFAAFDADVAVVAAYGLILPKEILDAPRRGCLNVHASLLPRWRGAAPVQRALVPTRWGGADGSASNAFDSTATGWRATNSLGTDAKGFRPVRLACDVSSLTAQTAGDQFLIGAITLRSEPVPEVESPPQG